MELRSNSVDPFLSDDVMFGGREVYFTASDVYTGSDDRIFVSGTMTDINSGVDKQYFIEVSDPDFKGFADKSWKEHGPLLESKMGGILEQKMAEGKGAFVFSEGEAFSNIEASIQENAAPPKPVATPEPEGPKPANLEAGEPIRISDIQGEPDLIEGFEVNGQKGDLVVHEIEFNDGKPFLTGTFSVDTPTGPETKEFVVAIESQRFPDVTELTNDQVKLLTGGEALQEMLETGQHPIVLSTGESFPNRAKILSDINGIQDLPTGRAFAQDIPYLARLGQDYPELVETLRLYEPGWAGTGRSDGLIKMAIAEHLDLDAGLRVQLIDQTDSLGEFAQKLNQRTDLFAKGADTRAAVEQMVEMAEAAANFNRPPRVGAGARLFAGLTGVGSALTAGAAAASTYEGSVMEALTHQQFADGVITEVQRDALLEFHNDTTNAQYQDTAVGALDQFVLPSLFVTLAVEQGARDALTRLANETGLPESIYQMHARSMFEGHTASHTAILEAASELPPEMDGQPEVLHGAIQLKNDLHLAQMELTNFRSPYNSVHIPDDIQEKIEAREELVASLEDSLTGEMEELMLDPDSFEVFMNMLPLDVRMDFVRALVVGHENLAEENPLVARATQNYMEGGMDHEAMMDAIEAKKELFANGAEGLNAYIASRILPEVQPTEAPVGAPETSWDEELVAQYYNPEALGANKGVIVEEFEVAHGEGLAPDLTKDATYTPQVSNPGLG